MRELPTAKILAYWFETLGPEKWFATSAALDLEIRDMFLSLYEEVRKHFNADPAYPGVSSAGDYLAAILLFDQFPRNMFRGRAQSFATDPLSLDLARRAVVLGFDLATDPKRRIFFYLPFEHSESLADQNIGVDLVRARSPLSDFLEYAEIHRDIIRRFGRFPHRNKILGRENSPAEGAYLADGGPNFGTSPENPAS